MITELSIANAALARIGSAPISAFDEETDRAAQVAAVFQDTVDLSLTAYAWSFARATKALALLAETPENGFRYAYALPVGAIAGPLALLTDPRAAASQMREFALESGKLYADSAPLWGAFLFRAAPDTWPADFRVFVTVAVAAALAVPICHDPSLKADLTAEAHGPPSRDGRGGLFERAALADAQRAGPLQSIGEAGGVMLAAWHGGR